VQEATKLNAETRDPPSQDLFFPSDAFVASARSYNMFKSMLQLGLIDQLIHAKAVAVVAAKVNWWRTDT